MTQKNMQKNKSVCEKSMQMMMNILKFSSFSLATMSLGDKHSPNSPLRLDKIAVESFTSFSPSSSQLQTKSKRKRSQAPTSKSKVQTYLMEEDKGDHPRSPVHRIKDDNDEIAADDGSFSDYIKRFHKRNENELKNAVTNNKATTYIRRFHEKNSRDNSLATSTKSLPVVLPPPPPPLKK